VDSPLGRTSRPELIDDRSTLKVGHRKAPPRPAREA
jgi:hypothetical protein